MAGKYPGIVKTKLDGVDQTEYLSGRSQKSARDTFFYYSSKHPSAVRYKNWKMYFAIAPETPFGFVSPASSDPVRSRHGQPQARSIRDGGWASGKRRGGWFAGALAAPATAYLYDWNMLPIGQLLWLKELESYKEFPPLQDPASYNLDQVMAELKKAPTHPSQ